MFGGNPENRIYSEEETMRAYRSFYDTGEIPDKALGTVVWDTWRAREFIPRTPEQITTRNAVILARRNASVDTATSTSPVRSLRRVIAAAAAVFVAGTHR